MNASLQQQRRTRLSARVIGPLLVVSAMTTVTRPDMGALLSDFEASTAWPWVTGSFMLMAALGLVALHPYWRGAAATTVSVLGWLFVLRAAFLLVFPHTFMTLADAAFEQSALWLSVDSILGIVGLYLTFVGWSPKPNPSIAQSKPPAIRLSV